MQHPQKILVATFQYLDDAEMDGANDSNDDYNRATRDAGEMTYRARGAQARIGVAVAFKCPTFVPSLHSKRKLTILKVRKYPDCRQRSCNMIAEN